MRRPSHAEVLRRGVHRERGIRKRGCGGQGVPNLPPEQGEDPREGLDEQAEAQSREHLTGEGTTTFASDQHLRARGALGVGQGVVFALDEGAPERHHHEHAEESPRQCQQSDPAVGEVVGP
jgi:hypothetical protein